ncbi:hypothetical protein CR513_52410, partial [Mucuna pruriens]
MIQKKGFLLTVQEPRPDPQENLQEHWRPFRITKEVRKRAYKLEHLDGQKIPCTWNATSLRFYYN